MTSQRRRTLTRDAVLDAALVLADEGGLGAVSMRRLASRLGVEAMSLYNHVTGKAELLDGMASRVFEAIALPEASLPWDERVRALIRGCYAAMRAHPAVVRALVAEAANPRSAGALSVIDVFGSVLAATADPAVAAVPDGERSEPIADWFTRMATPARLPHLYRALPALLDADCGADFDDELDLLIHGLGASARAGSALDPQG
jgi:TetR/AcrR family transcriptional regulator, tetracycline repressor protein